MLSIELFPDDPIGNIDTDLFQGYRDPSLRSGFQNTLCPLWFALRYQVKSRQSARVFVLLDFSFFRLFGQFAI